MAIDKIIANFQYIERICRLILVAVLIIEIIQMQFVMKDQVVVMNDQTQTISSLTEVIKTLPCVK